MRLAKGILWRRLADDQRIAVPIRPQHPMGRAWHTCWGAMRRELEQSPQRGGHLQGLPSFVQPHIPQPHIPVHGVLAQLDALPAVGRLATGEADRQAKVFQPRSFLCSERCSAFRAIYEKRRQARDVQMPMACVPIRPT
jgi:hypothetical protein